MKTLCAFFVWVFGLLFSGAAEIVAWKVPLSAYLDSGLRAEGIRKTERAPEMSPFFGENDELWDLKEVSGHDAPRIKTSPAWIVWNETTGRLIAKGSWKELSEIHASLDKEDLEMQRCRITLEILETKDSTVPPATDAKPLLEMDFMTRPNMRTTGTWSIPRMSAEYDAESSFEPGIPYITTKLWIKATLPDQADVIIETQLILKPNVPLWVARDVRNGKGIDLRVSASIVLLDGSPAEEMIMLQKGGHAVTLVGRPGPGKMSQVDNKGWLAVLEVPPGFFDAEPAVGDGLPEQHDPFSESPPQKQPSGYNGMASISPPPFLGPWLDHEVLDFKERMRKALSFDETRDVFVGFDPIAGRIHMYGPEKAWIEEMMQRYQMMISSLDGSPRPLVAVTLKGTGVTRLLTIDQQRGKLERVLAAADEKRMLEIEPTLGEGRDIIDLRLFYEEVSGCGNNLKANTNSTLREGVPTNVMSGQLGDGVERSLDVSGELIEIMEKQSP